jgi:hypothetical protein
MLGSTVRVARPVSIANAAGIGSTGVRHGKKGDVLWRHYAAWSLARMNGLNRPPLGAAAAVATTLDSLAKCRGTGS